MRSILVHPLSLYVSLIRVQLLIGKKKKVYIPTSLGWYVVGCVINEQAKYY